MKQLVGREAELGALAAALAGARAGHPRFVEVSGPAGIGKTSLVERFLEDCADVTVLRASGEEAETLLTYGFVDQLVRSAGKWAAGRRGGMRPAREGAQVADHVAVGAHLLGVIDGASGAGPVILLLDDAQWADQSSLRAITFVLRRLVADPVLAIVVLRDEESVAARAGSLLRLVNGPWGVRLRLGGLAESDLRDIAAQMGITGLTVRAARRLQEGTEGNPLYARALLEELSASGSSLLEQGPLPAPRPFRTVVMARVETCSPEARRLVEAAAVLGVQCELDVAARLAAITAPLTALDEAATADLLRPTAAELHSLGFTHPLVRSAVYDGLTHARRAELHTLATGLVADGRARLRHEVAAATGPSAQLCRRLVAFADREAGRQAWPSAIGHLIQAGTLCPDPDDGAALLVRAVAWMLLTGDAVRATAFTTQVTELAPSPQRDSVLGFVALARGEPAEAEELLDAAWQRCDPDAAPHVAAVIALMRAIHWYGRLDGPATVEWACRARTLAPPEQPVHSMAENYLRLGLALARRVEEALTPIGEARAGGQEVEGGWVMPRAGRGLVRLAIDDLGGAREDLAAVADGAVRSGLLHAAAMGLSGLAQADYLSGDWDGAVLYADRAVLANADAGYLFTMAHVQAVAALVPTAKGDWQTAEAQLAEIETDRGRYEREQVAVGTARGLLALTRSDARAALAALAPLACHEPGRGPAVLGFWVWQDIYAEALVAVGRFAEADAFLTPYEELAADTGRRSVIARLARARGQVAAAAGRPAAATAAFERASAALAGLGMPYEQALVDLAHGQVLRRAGQRRAAVTRLRAAHTQLVALGASPARERCARELDAAGQPPADRGDGDLAGLTAQESVVARLAAAGRTNRAIATELVVSIKTVEFHLRNVFHKLGVTSRKQLGARLGSGTPTGAHPGQT